MGVLFFSGLGLIIGSFLNVVINREATEEGIGGRSHCPQCKHTLSFLDLVPVLSWLLLRGHCRYCTKSISIQYPTVEIMTALLFLCVGLSPLTFIEKCFGLCIVSLLIAIAVYDLKYMLIPDRWSYAFSCSAFVFSALTLHSLPDAFFLALAGPLVAAPLWTLWRFSNGRWMGKGDVMFAYGMGWLLGIHLGYIALLGAFVFGAVVSVCILLPLGPILSYAHSRGLVRLSSVEAGFTMKSEVPFGPFLIASCLFVWFSSMYGIALPLPY